MRRQRDSSVRRLTKDLVALAGMRGEIVFSMRSRVEKAWQNRSWVPASALMHSGLQ